MKEPSVLNIQRNLDKFTPIYNEGEEINPIPKNIRITVYCESATDRGLLVGVFKKDIGIEILVAKSWIYHSELMEFTNSIKEK